MHLHSFEPLMNMTQQQIHKGDPRTCAIFIPAWGSSWGYSSFLNQNNCGLLARCVCHLHLLRSEREDKQALKCCTKIVDAFVKLAILKVGDTKRVVFNFFTNSVLIRGYFWTKSCLGG